jgi:biotin carboxyl carrier protein
VEYEFLLDNKVREVSLEKKEDGFVFSEGGEQIKINIDPASPNVISILMGARSFRVYAVRHEGKTYIQFNGMQFIVEDKKTREEGFQGTAGGSQEEMLLVKAPMPGKVIKVNVKENEEVRKNQTLAIVEAMKMENEIKSSIEGRVKKIFVKPDDLVDSEKPLIELENP